MKVRLFCLLMTTALAGCAPKMTVKPGDTEPTPVTSGPQAPSLVDVHSAVSDQDYQEAVAAVGGGEITRGNAASALAIAQYQYNKSNYNDALKTYQKVLAVTNLSSQLEKSQYMVGQVYYDKKDYLPALAAFQTVIQKYSKSSFVSQSRQMMEFILGYSLSLDDLKRYVTNYPDSPMNCSALFQLGSRQAREGMQSEALENLNTFTDQCSQHASASAAKLLLQSLENQQQGKTWKIGVLVPKTGRFKSFGQSVLNGITLAMEQANQAGGSRKPMALVVQDTMGDAIRAVKVFQEMIKDDSLDAVIGPVGSAEIQAVAPLTNERRITLISPAMSRDGLSSLGPYLFSNGMTNEMQGRVIARFAVEKLGLRKFGILAPDDGYGETLSDAFKKTVESMGATVTASVTYPPTATDFKKQLVGLGGQDPETSKESDRDNNRKLEELKYNMKKEVGKILLKAKEAGGSADPSASQAVAFIPFTEGLTNTTCASVLKGINDALKADFQDQKDLPVRNDDLVHQVMDRLPVEYRGTTLPVSADVWGDLAGDLDASLLVTGRVIQTNPPGDWSDHATWDFSVVFEAFQWNPKKNSFSKVYSSRLLYSTFKPASLIRVNSNIQALYLPAHSVEIPSLASQIHFYDMNPVFLGGHLWDNEAVRKDAAKDVEGAYFVTGFYPDSQQGAARKFSEDYLARFAKRPDLLAAQAFDAARLLLKATQDSLSRDDIHNRLMGIRNFDGASGNTSFNGKGEAEKVVPVLRIQGGKYQQVQ